MIGLAIGVLAALSALGEITSQPFGWSTIGGVLYALTLPFAGAYMIPCWYLGFQIPCSLCIKLARTGENASGWQALAYSIGAFSLRLTVSLYGGIFGYGIVQYRRLLSVVRARDTAAGRGPNVV